jgi:hypothetical protein
MIVFFVVGHPVKVLHNTPKDVEIGLREALDDAANVEQPVIQIF